MKAPRRRWRRALLTALAALLLAAVACELGFRWLVFSGHERGAKFRHPRLFADVQREDLHWVLRHRFGANASATPFEPDPLLGWRGRALIRPETYAHAEIGRLEGRRPVLLFGDSFAACTTPREVCWEGLLLESELGDEFMCLNYGVSAFGFDQTVLLFEQAVDWIESRPDLGKPVLVLSAMVDDDLNRTDLRIREWPRPHFERSGGEWVLRQPPTLDNDEWIDAHAPFVASYLLRFMVHGQVLPESLRRPFLGDGGHRARVAERTAMLVDRVADRLAGTDHEFFALLLPGEEALESGGAHLWQEALLEAQLARHGLRSVNARQELEQDMRETGRTFDAYFGTQGRGVGHYIELGNRVAFRALLRGLEGGG